MRILWGVFKEQRLTTHQRFCDAVEEEEASQDVKEHSELEETVLNCDNDSCVLLNYFCANSAIVGAHDENGFGYGAESPPTGVVVFK